MHSTLLFIAMHIISQLIQGDTYCCKLRTTSTQIIDCSLAKCADICFKGTVQLKKNAVQACMREMTANTTWVSIWKRTSPLDAYRHDFASKQ
jgi:hypothetical protein